MDPKTIVAQDGGQPTQGPTVLLVDDEASVLSVVRRLLQRAGLTVLTATEGKEAIRIFESAKDVIRVAVLDLTMPGMDGESLYRELARIKPGLAVIFASGYGGDEVAARYAPGQIVGFIQKPYQHEVLIRLIRTALGS